jgi:S1-C subfamily serine protease
LRNHSLHHGADGAGSDFMPVAEAFNACVKVFCTAVAPCYALPWVRGEESHATGSGFAVLLPSGVRRLLVHAHVLENHALVQVRRVNEAQKYVAQVDCVGYDVDVGVLKVPDEQFWRSIPLLQLPSGLPSAMAEVVTAGFPAGGEELSITRGVVNRILLGGVTRELCVQMDAAIDPGNSGGPVFNTSAQVVGMACSGSQHAAGYMIPLPVIHAFLENARIAAEAGQGYMGKSVDHYRVQPLENPELRVHLGLPARPLEGEEGGVLLSKLGPDAACAGVLQDGDVLLSVDGVPIAADGTVVLPEAPLVRVGMRHCVQRVPIGSQIEYHVQRDGARLTVHVEATTRKPRLLPPRQPVPRPEWVVLGGLVFTPLLPDYEGLVPKCKLQMIHGPPTPDCEQVVMLLRVLQSEVNIGYEDVCGMLESFNGEKVVSLMHLARLAEDAQASEAGLLEFMLVTGELLVLEARRCWQTEQEIFATHTIPARCSAGVTPAMPAALPPPAGM